MRNSVTVYMLMFLVFVRWQTISEMKKKVGLDTLGAYVGVAPVQMMVWILRNCMAEIHRELLSLQAESNDLMDTISKNMKEMGL